ncbi:phage holin family protein [Cellulomonas septica]|uniref:Phage holin family protein n=1 Tax=Cellulomonas septica TaxID=285080 RepID=A0ABX1JWP9_9CELL|nr:phage holin family protein [Cellulomonas septica]NKY38389.1 phage holin family protein [Cellulomonas septica]
MSETGAAPPQPSVGELVGEVTRDLSTLIRQEVELAKAEARQSVQHVAKSGSMFAGAGVAGHFVLLFLSIALWWAIGDAIGLGWSAVVVAVIWGIVAAVLFARGRAESRRVEGLPRTTDTVSKIPNALRGQEEKNA